MKPTPSTLGASCGRGSKPLWSTMPQHENIVALFRDVSNIPTIEQRNAMSDQQLYDIVQSDTPKQTIQKLQHYAYVAAYHFLHTVKHTTHQQAQEQNIMLHKIQQSIDRIALDTLQEDPKALQDYIASQVERQK